MVRPPRRPTARKRTVAPVAAPLDGDVVAEGQQQAAAPEEPDREKIVGEFGAVLRQQPGIDEEGVEFVLEHFREAIAEAPIEPVLSKPDRASWLETLDVLVENGLLDDLSRSALVREFDAAIGQLQNDEVRIAVEFAQRLKRDGEEAALAWLATAKETAVKQDARESASSTDQAVFRQSITKSRSRRLRGPPSRV